MFNHNRLNGFFTNSDSNSSQLQDINSHMFVIMGLFEILFKRRIMKDEALVYMENIFLETRKLNELLIEVFHV